MPENKRAVGGEKERQAGRYLEEQGYVILEYNYRTRMAEADLVCRDGDTYVFVEVKYRKSRAYGHPLEAVNRAKQNRIHMAALYYLEDHGLIPSLTPVRFDVIGILGGEMTLIKDAF